MRLHQYINEMTTPEDWEQITNALEKHCQPFLKELKGANALLYRGTDDVFHSPIRQYNVRKNRKPRFIAQDLHELMDEWFQKKVGWKVRSEGLFTSCDINLAKRFTGLPGTKIGLVFPIGSFKYVWNPYVYDLYNEYDYWLIHDKDKEYRDAKWHFEISSDLEEYKSTNLHKYLTDAPVYSECILGCDKYYLINIEWQEHLMGKYM